MKLFQKHKNKEQPTSRVSDRVAGKIADWGLALQNRFARGMDKGLNGMKTRKLKIWLAIFCIGCGGYSIYITMDAILSSSSTKSSIRIEPVNVPKHFDKTGDEPTAAGGSVDEATYRKVKQFSRYMDSLKTLNSSLYDSIVTARPHLMDTVRLLEEIYRFKNKNEVYE